MPRKSKQLKKPYKGALSKYIKIPKPQPKPTILGKSGTKHEQEDQYQKTLKAYEQENAKFISTEIARKMDLLVEHFDLQDFDGNVWFQVALNLAIDHVDGFKIEEEGARGRPLKWNLLLDAKLYFDVLRETKGNLGKGRIENACYDLCNKEPWKSLLTGRRNMPAKAKTLQNRFPQACKSSLINGFQALPNEKELKDTFHKDFEATLKEFFKNFPIK